jgi:CheY-like chemotaxis protein
VWTFAQKPALKRKVMSAKQRKRFGLGFSRHPRGYTPRKKVLVVDDNQDARVLIEAVLKTEGLAVIKAADGQEGLERALEEPPDLIITDISMPRLSGLQLIRQLRGLPRFKEIPILAVTAFGIEKAIEAIKAGANRALARPIENHLLLAFVYDLLNSHK